MSEWPDIQLNFDEDGGRYLEPRMSAQPGMSVRRALIIGIDYSSHQDPLRFCVKDAYIMENFLHDNLGFAYDDIRVMTDDNQSDHPTKENILRAMKALVNGARPNDSFFFYFSGRAFQIKGFDGGLDECICATDYPGDDLYPDSDTPGIIVNDTMHDLMVKPLPSACRLTAVFDCCHSASLLDLPYIYGSGGVIKPRHPNALMARVLQDLHEKASYADVVSLSACKDNENSVESNRGGALQCAFIDCMSAFDNTLTLRQLIRGVRDHMTRHGIRQKPQLSSSHEIDADVPFIV
ncbi:peptidase C14, caspase domain-containing protein [Russula aff. rugulosa BPL654]|nr:peptidase C14, caspase domain-containing protein [Russula aff. rugulosa BPL654]